MKNVLWRFSALLALGILWILPQGVSARTVEFQTTQVTAADVALSPDGKTLVFTMLGHLFNLPANGGTAEQLTFGPYYDNDPVFSPDGSQVAFASDRDGSEGNIFVLTLQGRHFVQLNRDERAGRPTWSPDGKSIIYLGYARWTPKGLPAVVSRISVHGGQPEILSAPPRRIGSTFYLPDGRLAWSTIEQGSEPSEYVTRIETLSPQGTVSTLRTIVGLVDWVLPKTSGDGLYCHRLIGNDVPTREDVILVSTSAGSEKEIVPVSSLGRFALSADGKNLYLGDQGHLWKVLLPAGGSQAVTFLAHVTLETQEISKPRRFLAVEGNAVRAILTPRLSPDGRTVVFGAAGFLWQQRLDGGEKAHRISQDTALETEPAFAPDGGQLAFVHTEHGEDSVRLLDLASGQTRMLTSGPSISELAWSSDGKRLIALVSDQHVMAFNIADGKGEQLADTGSWSPRPQLSPDGHALFYSADTTGVGNLYRLALSKDARPEQITNLTRHLSDARISPDGKWLVFRRNHSILAASLANNGIQDTDVHELAAEGGDSFALTSDGSSVIYAIAERVWRQPVSGGGRQEIPIALDLPRLVPSPIFPATAPI